MLRYAGRLTRKWRLPRRPDLATRMSRPARLSQALTTLVVPVAGILLLTSTFPGAARLAARLAAAATTLSRRAPPAPQTTVSARAAPESAAVGALFTLKGGTLGKHFCTASVVNSGAGDLLITAAHCVSSRSPRHVAFVPAYHDGSRPYGVWLVSQIVVDSQWRGSASPDHDVAFLVVHRPGDANEIQQVTGGERLGTGWPQRTRVTVIGYPDQGDAAISCQRFTRPFGPDQLEFDCGGYTDGTSGGPFLARTGAGSTVIGLIGGYEQGGDLASVSYSPRFGPAVQALYWAAVSDGGGLTRGMAAFGHPPPRQPAAAAASTPAQMRARSSSLVR